MSPYFELCTAVPPSKLKEHSDSKHPKNTFPDCFPGMEL